MALYFDGSSYIKFPNIKHTPDFEPCAIVALIRPDDEHSTLKYILSQEEATSGYSGGESLYILTNDEIKSGVKRASGLKSSTTTDSPMIFEEWNVIISSDFGDLDSTSSPAIYCGKLGGSLSLSTVSSALSSNFYEEPKGHWGVGGYAPLDSNFFIGSIEYLAYYQGDSLAGNMDSFIAGISPTKIAPKYLKFFVRLSDPNNVIDLISGRKAGIIGSLTEPTSQPRVSY